MTSRQIETVIDVGANAGQFARLLREGLAYQGWIISIEPLPDAFAILRAKAAGNDKWSILNLALGDGDVVLPLNVSDNSVSSSILPVQDR